MTVREAPPPGGTLGVALAAAATLVAPSDAAETRRVMAGPARLRHLGAFHNFFMGSGYRKEWVTPDRLPGARPRDLRRRPDAGAAGRRHAEPRPGAQGQGRARATRSGPRTRTRRKILPPEWADTRAGEALPGRDGGEPPRQRLRRARARRGRGRPALEPALRVHARRPGARRVPQDLRRPAGDDRGVPAARAGRHPGLRGRGRDPLDGRALEAQSSRARRGSTSARSCARGSSTSGSGTGTGTTSSGAGCGGKAATLFEPLPEDRDQAFSKFGGLLLATARATHPKFMDWKDHYPNFEGWMTQGGEVDRWMLSEIGPRRLRGDGDGARRAAHRRGDRRRGEAAAAGVVRDSAGAELAAALEEAAGRARRGRARVLRAALPQGGRPRHQPRRRGAGRAARRRPARGRARRRAATPSRGSAGPSTRARPSEVRLYLYGGADRVVTEGPAGGPITLRVVGGSGTDTLDDSKSGGTRFYDFEGSRVVKGAGHARRPTAVEAAPGEAEGDALARVARLGQPHAAAVQGVVGAGPGRDRWPPASRTRPGASASSRTRRCRRCSCSTASGATPSSSTTTASSGARTRSSTSSSTRRPRSSRTSTTSASATSSRTRRPRARARSTSTSSRTPTGSHALVALGAQPHLRGLRGTRGEVDATRRQDQSGYIGRRAAVRHGRLRPGRRARGLRPRHARAPAGRHGGRPVPLGRQAGRSRACGSRPRASTTPRPGTRRSVRRRRRPAARLPRREARDARGAGRRPAGVGRVPVVRGGVHRRQQEPARLPQEPLRRRLLALRQPRGAAVAASRAG